MNPESMYADLERLRMSVSHACRYYRSTRCLSCPFGGEMKRMVDELMEKWINEGLEEKE